MRRRSTSYHPPLTSFIPGLQPSFLFYTAYYPFSSMAGASPSSNMPAGTSSPQMPCQTDMELISEVMTDHLQHVHHDGQLTAQIRRYLDKIKECRGKQRQEEVQAMQTAISTIQARMQHEAPFTPFEREKYGSFNGTEVDSAQELLLDELVSSLCLCLTYSPDIF
jgi:hypothetical protein